MKKIALAAVAALTLGIAGVSATAPAAAHGWHGGGHHGWHGGGHHRWGKRKISCRKGMRIVRRSGFRGVRPMKCFGKRYVYRAFKWGVPYKVRVHSRRGHVVSARAMY
jgi:hypothetical protein